MSKQNNSIVIFLDQIYPLAMYIKNLNSTEACKELCGVIETLELGNISKEKRNLLKVKRELLYARLPKI